MTSRIRLYSDLHLETRTKEQTAELLEHLCDGPAPALTIMAGDVVPIAWALAPGNEHAIMFLREYARRRGRVIYVLGNHDVWFGKIAAFEDLLKDFQMAIGWRFEILRRSTSFLGRRRILGCTMYWATTAQRTMDYNVVPDLHPWATDQGAADEAWLRAEVRPGDVVVTHLLPSMRCEDPRYAGRPSNAYFVRPMDDLIETAKPAVWCFGHTHCGVDRLAGDTHLLANPLGRADEGLAPIPFDPTLEIEL